jgi:putative methionine-R-sulfoxide reductase with GAF domain
MTNVSADVATTLMEVIDEFECTAGTIHRREGESLELLAAEAIPGEVRDRIESIPIGKGMAGLAADRREPVATCDLQVDEDGVAERGARATGLKGTVAVPMVADDGSLEGVLGVGKREEYEFSTGEREALLEVASRIATEF